MISETWAELATWSSALLVSAGGLSAALSRLQRTSRDSAHVEAPQIQFSRVLHRHLQSRLHEARQLLQREEAVARRNSFAAATLLFGQYIVGGTLATSFVQEFLSRNLVGALGVIVLAASLVQKAYRPDVAARSASARAVRLRAIIRQVEDEMPSLRNADDAAITETTERLSAGIRGVELSGLNALPRGR